MTFQFSALARKNLGFFPTPLVELEHLSQRLGGPRILMKRDDQTGLASGGNKTRKLEFLLGDALARGCDTVVTGGAAQSNHCRQTAAAAACCGVDCHLVLGGRQPEVMDGNLLLDNLFGATLHWSGACRRGEKIPEIVDELTALGRKPYLIPYGGSNAIGALGFVTAMAELELQLQALETTVTDVVFATSSGGTQAGMVVGKSIQRQPFNLIGIGIDKGEAGDDPFADQVLGLANRVAQELETETGFNPSDIIISDEYLGKGYGVMGERERRAIRLVAETEGILLDPVYTGRAMGGLIDMIEQHRFSRQETVLFWHTGGLPALFSSAEELQQ